MNAPQSIFAVSAFCAAGAFAPAFAAQEATPVVPDLPDLQDVAAEVVQLTSSRVPAAMAVLVPDEASVFAISSTLNEIEAFAAGIAQQVSPDMAGMVSLDMLFSEVLPPGFDASAIDRDKPFGFAVASISMMSTPQIVVMVPTSKPDAIKALLPQEGMVFTTRMSGGYLAITEGASFPESTGKSKLLDQVAPGLISLSVDLEPIFDAFGPMIEGGLNMARMEADKLAELMAEFDDSGMDIAGIMNIYFGFAEDALDSLTGFNLSVVGDGSLLDLRYELLVDEGSPMSNLASSKPTDLAGNLHLLRDDAISVAFGGDMLDLFAKSDDLMESLFSAYPAPMGGALVEGMDSWTKAYGLFGTSVVGSGSLGENGMRMTTYFNGEHFDELLAEYEAMVQKPFFADLGLRFRGTEKAELAGTSITRFTFDFDMEGVLQNMGEEPAAADLEQMTAMIKKMYGEQLVFTLAKSGDKGIFLIGGDDAMLRKSIGHLASDGTAPADVLRLQDLAATNSPFFVERFNLGALITDFFPALAPAGAQLPPEAAVLADSDAFLNLYGGMTSSSWTSGITVDLVEIGRAVMAGMPGR